MSRLREAMDAVRTHPKNASAWVALGEVLTADGQLEKATQSFQRALQLEPTNSAAQRGLAQILLANGGGMGTAPLQPPPASANTPRATAQSMPALPPTPNRSPEAVPFRDTGPQRAVSPETERTAAPRSPITREEATSRRAAPRPTAGSAMEMRTPPPQAIKPSEGRLMAGIIALILIPTLCLCAVIFGLAQLI